MIKPNGTGSPLRARAEQRNGQRGSLAQNLAAQTLGWPFALARAVHAGLMAMEKVAWAVLHPCQFQFQLSPEYAPWA